MECTIGWTSFVTGVISGAVASILFWLVFFKCSLTKIVFSNVLIRTKNVSEDGGEYRYRIRVANVGFVNLMDIETRTTIRIKKTEWKFTNTAPAILGPDGHMTMLKKSPAFLKWASNQKDPKGAFGNITTIYLTENAFKYYKMNFYDEEIRTKANSGELTIHDLWEKYRDQMTIRILLHGTDNFSGRRIFVVKEYKFSDIVEAVRFSPIKPPWENLEKTPLTIFRYRK